MDDLLTGPWRRRGTVMWHVEGVTPDGMHMEWTRRYNDDEILALMSALVNAEPWGTAEVKLTRVVPA